MCSNTRNNGPYNVEEFHCLNRTLKWLEKQDEYDSSPPIIKTDPEFINIKCVWDKQNKKVHNFFRTFNLIPIIIVFLCSILT